MKNQKVQRRDIKNKWKVGILLGCVVIGIVAICVWKQNTVSVHHNEIENINISNILYTESRSHYQHVNFTQGGQVRSRMTVSELFDELSQYGGFVRGGSAYIINLNKVKSVSTGEVCFNNNVKLLLPRGAHNEIKKAFWLLQYDGQE